MSGMNISGVANGQLIEQKEKPVLVKGHEYQDENLERLARLAESLGAKAYDGGWPKLMNWKEQALAITSNSSFTTIINIGATQTPNIPANTLVIGSHLRVRAWGSLGSAAGTATYNIGLMLNGGANGAAGAGTALASSATQTPATSTVNTWFYDSECVVITTGTGGTIQTFGILHGFGATASTPILVPATQAAAATLNTTVANYINLTAVCSASAAGNTITVNGFSVELLN